MTSYLIRIEGRGLRFVVAHRWSSLLNLIGLGRSEQCSGFFTTRCVESISEVAATALARKQVIDELLKKRIFSIENLNQLDLRIDEVLVVPAGQNIGPKQGFTFYK